MVKEWFKNFLSTTAITIIIITFIAVITGDDSVKVLSIFPSVAANAVIHLGLYFLNKLDTEYYLLEMGIKFGYVLAVVLATGYLTGWFVATPVWVTVVITAAVFLCACLISILHVNRALDDINHEIKLRQKELGAKELQ